ncbi:MAG: GNAT family N-acetyltransferase [Bacteroidetes bacterium]|nr:GNAT family N-acetyltransferase [Bacteroidota bacterium]
MLTIKRTNSDNTDFHLLVSKLDKDLLDRYGALQDYYSRFNSIKDLPAVVMAYYDGQPVGCGCFKQFDDGSVEVKRMYVSPEERGKGIGAAILAELEKWAAELKVASIVLETGNNQPEALHLYQKMGYTVIPNYDQYSGMETSICMKKELV